MEASNRPKSTREAKKLEKDMARIGKILSERYELLELLGHGGMGAVYKARHIQMERIVAIKLLLPDVAEDPTMHDRFRREAKASGKINHPNVVQLIDFGEGPEGEAYIVIEFLDGVGIDHLIRQEGFIEVNRAVHIFKQICDGVAKAHAKGIIHRDLKPSNVMLVEEESEQDFVKIVDFGLAKALDPGEESQKLTQTGEVFGSPIYMSPEQCLGQRLDHRSDIYALGVLMYECLTGRVPFLGSVVAETIARQLHDSPKPFKEMRPDLELNVPDSLEAVVMKALSKDPYDRQASMQELKDEIIDAMLPKLKDRSKKAKASSTQIAKPVTLEFGKPRHSVEMPQAEPEDKVADLPGSRRAGNAVSEPERSDSARSKGPAIRLSGPLIVILSLAVVLILGVGIGVCLRNTGKNPEPQAASNLNQDKNPVLPGLQGGALLPENRKPDPLKKPDNQTLKNQGANKLPKEPVQARKAPEPPKPVISKSSSNSNIASQKKKTQKTASAAAKKEYKPQNRVQSASRPDLPTSDGAGSGVSRSQSRRKHQHRDWHDYSYGVEKKDSYSHSWDVPNAGTRVGD